MSKKELIIEKAIDLFANEGYENCGVLQIVKEADVTKPTLYHYFGSKEGLLNSIYERYFQQFIHKLEEVLPYQKDVNKTIEDVIRIYIYYAKSYPNFFWLSNHLRKSPRRSPSRKIVQQYYEKENELILHLIQSISQHHTNLKGNESFLAVTFLGLVNGFLEIKMESEELYQIDDASIHKLAKQFLYGVFSL